MIRGLAIVAIGGAALSILCIGASGATSQNRWHVPGMNWAINSDHDDDADNGPSMRLNGDEKIIDRDLPWAGSESLTFDVPAQITYTQGPIAKITLHGPDTLLAHVVLDGNEIRLNRHIHHFDSDHMLSIIITGPALHDFELNSAQSLHIQSIATDELKVEINGAGKVDANGRARSVHVEIDGAGAADLGGLTVSDAHLEINGIGQMTAGPTGDAHVEINGAGKVELTKRPAQLEQEINGAGSVTQPDGPKGQAL